MSKETSVWVFCGDNASFPSAVFSTFEKANEWISRKKLSGLLTEYPLDEGVYDWSVRKKYFTPSKPLHMEPKFIGRFTTASQSHYRFENGCLK
jgi:hypothetical protein